MLAIILFTAFFVIRTAPDSLFGRALGRWLVDWPAAKLARLTRGQLACWVALGIAISAGVAILDRELVVLLALALPDTIAWLAMVDMSVLADALVVGALVATHARLGRLRASLPRLGLRRPRPRSRTARRRRTAAPKPDNDGEPAPAFLLAA